MAKLSNEEYVQALEKMKNSPRDRVGTLGEFGVAGIGVTAGGAASGKIAALFGANTLLGSSTLAKLLGGIFVTTTPVGWIVGCAIGGGALAYGVSKLVRSGGKSDAKREMNIRELTDLIAKKKRESESTGVSEEKYKRLIESLQLLVINRRITQEKSEELLMDIKNGRISIDFAFNVIEGMLREKQKKQRL